MLWLGRPNGKLDFGKKNQNIPRQGETTWKVDLYLAEISDLVETVVWGVQD